METSRIFVTLNAKIKDVMKCKIAMQTIVEAAHKESTTKSHWWCIGEDNESLFVLEQYDDVASAMAHIQLSPPARQDFFESIEVVNVVAYGDLTTEIKEMLAPLNPIYMSYYGGFSK